MTTGDPMPCSYCGKYHMPNDLDGSVVTPAMCQARDVGRFFQPHPDMADLETMRATVLALCAAQEKLADALASLPAFVTQTEGAIAAQQAQIDALDKCSAFDKKALIAHAKLLEELGNRVVELEHARGVIRVRPEDKSIDWIEPGDGTVHVTHRNGKRVESDVLGKAFHVSQSVSPAGPKQIAVSMSFDSAIDAAPRHHSPPLIVDLPQPTPAQRLAEINARLAELNEEAGKLRGEKERLRGQAEVQAVRENQWGTNRTDKP